jgi:hypothetical protein
VRFHRLRLGHDLAERERGRKNLDEYRVHGTDPLISPKRYAESLVTDGFVRIDRAGKLGDERRSVF